MPKVTQESGRKVRITIKVLQVPFLSKESLWQTCHGSDDNKEKWSVNNSWKTQGSPSSQKARLSSWCFFPSWLFSQNTSAYKMLHSKFAFFFIYVCEHFLVLALSSWLQNSARYQYHILNLYLSQISNRYIVFIYVFLFCVLQAEQCTVLCHQSGCVNPRREAVHICVVAHVSYWGQANFQALWYFEVAFSSSHPSGVIQE